MVIRLRLEAINSLHLEKTAIIDQQYRDLEGNLYIGTNDRRIRKLPKASEVTFNTTVTNSATDTQVALENLTELDSGVTSGTYGDATNIPQIIVDVKGNVTSAVNVPIVIPATFITSILDTATVDLTVVAGVLSADIIPGSIGDVIGPVIAVDNNIATFDGVSGKLIKDGGKTIAALDFDIAAKEPANANIQAHIIDTANPHAVTATQVGLGNVDNTSDATKNSATVTLTNKRITARIGTETSSATSTPTADSIDQWNVTALAVADTFAEPTGIPTDGQNLIIRIRDDGTARALGWNAIYEASSDLALPTTTIVNKTIYLGFRYNVVAVKWQLLALLNNFTL